MVVPNLSSNPTGWKKILGMQWTAKTATTVRGCMTTLTTHESPVHWVSTNTKMGNVSKWQPDKRAENSQRSSTPWESILFLLYNYTMPYWDTLTDQEKRVKRTSPLYNLDCSFHFSLNRSYKNPNPGLAGMHRPVFIILKTRNALPMHVYM